MDEIRRGMTNNKNLEVTCQLASPDIWSLTDYQHKHYTSLETVMEEEVLLHP
jgi:hypothetical protein